MANTNNRSGLLKILGTDGMEESTRSASTKFSNPAAKEITLWASQTNGRNIPDINACGIFTNTLLREGFRFW